MTTFTAIRTMSDHLLDLVFRPAEVEFRDLINALHIGDLTACELVALVTILRSALERKQSRETEPASLEVVRERGRTKR